MSAIVQQRPIPSSVVLGVLLGIIFQVLLAIFQPMLEPTYVWAEVAAGVIMAFAIAEYCVTVQETGPGAVAAPWRDYRNILFAAFFGLGVPIVLYEIVNHLVLNRPV